jgi:hypothetical protein
MDMSTPLGANANGKYSVFFSHKVNDERVTKSLIELLDGHTENVSFPISEQIEKGTPWRKAIAELLSKANFLVLVFTDPSEDWGWCLYEDAFEGADKEKLLDIIDKWNETYPKIWRGIGFSDVMKTFGEVSKELMSVEDQCLLQSELQKLERLNRDFLAMAVARAEVRIQNELRTNIGVDVDNIIEASNLHLQSAAA